MTCIRFRVVTLQPLLCFGETFTAWCLEEILAGIDVEQSWITTKLCKEKKQGMWIYLKQILPDYRAVIWKLRQMLQNTDSRRLWRARTSWRLPPWHRCTCWDPDGASYSLSKWWRDRHCQAATARSKPNETEINQICTKLPLPKSKANETECYAKWS